MSSSFQSSARRAYNNQVALIVGLTVGILGALVLGGLLIFCWFRSSEKKKQARKDLESKAVPTLPRKDGDELEPSNQGYYWAGGAWRPKMQVARQGTPNGQRMEQSGVAELHGSAREPMMLSSTPVVEMSGTGRAVELASPRK